MEGAHTTVWILESDHWPRALLRAELLERGYDAIAFENAEQAREAALAHTVVWPPEVMLVDLAHTDEGEVVAFAQLAAKRGVPLVALARAAGTTREPPGPWTTLLHRPITLGQIADTIARLRPA
jgi:hypothetical protein